MKSSKKLQFINRLIRTSARGDYRFFFSHCHRPQAVQSAVLKRILRCNRSCAFFREKDLAAVRSPDDFRKALPVQDYTAFLPYILRQRTPDSAILTAEKVRLFEPTGGTSGGSKFIPYTRSLQREFQRGINTWLYDLFTHYPALLKGQSYWSISPPVDRTFPLKTSVPVGFESDAAYLGPLGRWLQTAFAVPSWVKFCLEYADFRYLSCLYLLRASNLSLISVWNPGFLLLLLESLQQEAENLIRDIHDGGCSHSLPREQGVAELNLGPSPRRSGELEKLLGKNPVPYSRLWPALQLISCWTGGAAGRPAARLREIFPEVTIQGKGLLATEGFITLPLEDARGYLPAYTSHFLEFLDETSGDTYLLNELKDGESYQVVLTTGGGLYRYNLKDKVTVSGYFRGLPLLQFTGRAEVSDQVGEKLEENHVEQVLRTALACSGITPRFLLLAPQQRGLVFHYVLYLEPAGPVPAAEVLAGLVAGIEAGLRENFHYAYAVRLGQLEPVEIFLLSGSGEEVYQHRCRAEGQRAGDIKPVLLSSRTDWKHYFKEQAGLIQLY